MTTKRFQFIRIYPAFVFMLPVFFVLHGFTENYDFVPVKDALLLTGVYLLSTGLVFLLSWLFYKNRIKAALAAFLLMGFHFFFGAIQDGLRDLFPGTFVTKYVFILPVAFILLVAIIILLKKGRKPLLQLNYYLNILAVLLLVIDVAWLLTKTAGSDKNGALSKEFISCEKCNRPDVYIIITDEYAGNTELRDIFDFDNTSFIRQLGELGFHTIPFSSSNYNFTPHSIASTLNMEYLDLERTGKQPLLAYMYETIRNNQLAKFLQFHQYQLYNYSYFDIKGHPAHTQETFLPVKTKLITGQTFLSRLNKELRFNLVTRFNSKREIRNFVYANKENNETLFRLTLKTAREKKIQPKFVLTHLMMPHYPYYFDRNGNEFPFDQLTEGNQKNYGNYIEYLQYTNKKILELINQIKNKAASPPVIILMGDHGFRHFKQPQAKKYYFSNLVSVYLPDENYSAFSDSLTNVNLLRTVLNVSFQQQLAYLKDTTLIMDNP